MKDSYKKIIYGIILLLVFLLIIFLILHLFSNKKKPARQNTVVVVAAPVKRMDVPIYLDALGTVTPTYTITVRTQINGQLQQVLYHEGQLVKPGQQIAQIDPRPYEAQLTQYEGQFARDNALLTNAKLDLQRYQTLWRQNAIAKQTLDTQAALVRQYEGNVITDKGLIQNTRLNLTYCKISSPIFGRIGLRLVDPGNYVQTTDTNGIAVITQLNPITIVFTIPEDNILSVQKAFYENKTLQAQAFDRDQNKLLATGNVLAIDNQIDPSTGTVKIKAAFNNAQNLLFPSQFVNIRLFIGTLPQALVTPTAAIQFGQKGSFVYLLNKDKTVKIQAIIAGPSTGENTAITQGLVEGQKVITEGTDKLATGTKVTLAAGAHG